MATNFAAPGSDGCDLTRIAAGLAARWRPTRRMGTPGSPSALLGALITLALAAGCASGPPGGSHPHTTTATSSAASPQSSPSTAPGISLQLPAELAKGTTNPIAFTVTNPGPARTVDVQLDLGAPNTPWPGDPEPAEQAILLRRDPATGAWQPIAVTLSTARHDTARFALGLPAHAAVTQQLRLTPVGSTGTTLGVTLTGSALPTVSRSARLPLAAPALRADGPAALTRGGAPGQFDFTLTNPTPGDYTGVELYLDAYSTTSMCINVLDQAQWSIAEGWHTVSLAAQWPLLDTIALPRGHSLTIRIQAAVPAAFAPCARQAVIAMIAETPGAGSLLHAGQNLTPSFGIRSDAPVDLH
jgi:hypothetical protein